MKKAFVFIAIISLLFVGCKKENDGLSRVLQFRQRLIQSQGCSFYATIEADYGEIVYRFSMACKGDVKGNLSFQVTAPESISGITGTFDARGGRLTFQDEVLSFPTLADGALSPVSGAWILLNTLMDGYISTVGAEGDLLRATIYEGYEDDSIQVEVWFSETGVPVRGEILWEGRSVLSIAVESFAFL